MSERDELDSSLVPPMSDLYRKCPECGGTGYYLRPPRGKGGQATAGCSACDGTGYIQLDVTEEGKSRHTNGQAEYVLRARVIKAYDAYRESIDRDPRGPDGNPDTPTDEQSRLWAKVHEAFDVLGYCPPQEEEYTR